MHLEALHQNLKYNYFSGKTVRRLETCLDALDKLILDKSWKRVASVLRPTATHRDLLVNKFHKRAMEMSFKAVAKRLKKFLVHSQSKIDFYEVDMVNENCNCRTLRCRSCNSCIHRFRCSCYEASVKNNFCKHMHLVAMYITQKVENGSEKDVKSPFLDEPSTSDKNLEQKFDQPSTSETNLEQELDLRMDEICKRDIVDSSNLLQQCKNIFNSIIDQCTSTDDFVYLRTKLLEVNSHINKTDLPKSQVTKRKIEKQTFFPTTK